jgi:hypothetical protein
MIAGSPCEPMPGQSRHGPWRDSLVSHATPRGATRSAMSVITFSNTTVYTSRATSCGLTQLLVAPWSLARPKGLVIANIVWGELFLKFYFKKG